MTASPLESAREVLSGHGSALTGVWQRAVAFLARQALEDTISQTLRTRAPGADTVSARAQLLCLASFVPDALAHDAAFVWSVLTRACHHHGYELAPTWEELQDWLAQTERVCQELEKLSKPVADQPESR